MTLQQLALRLLKHIGVTSLDAEDDANAINQRGLVAGDLDDVAVAITAALQEITGEGPSALSEQRVAGVLRGPQVVELGVTQFTTNVGSFPDFDSRMIGCTVRLAGDEQDNEIVSETELLRPYMGVSGAVSATVYGDAFLLPSTVKNIMDPVNIPGLPDLSGVTTREEFEFANTEDYRSHQRSNDHSRYTAPKSSGRPCIWYCEPRLSATGSLDFLLRITPMPDQAYSITFRAKKKPPTITGANIADGGTYPDKVTVALADSFAAGDYYRVQGFPSAKPVYVKSGTEDTAMSLAHNGSGSWWIQPLGTDFPAFTAPDRWQLAGESPLGTYEAQGAYGGAPIASGASGATDLGVPLDWHESILLPFALQRWTSHPAFGSDGNKLAEIGRQYRVAKELLQSFVPAITPSQGHYH